MKQIIAFISIGILTFVGGYFYHQKTMSSRIQKQQNTVVLLEKIKKVTKLVTVEGYFSELYTYQDYKTYDWALLRKKAILKVDATVTAGYDLEQVNFTLDSLSKIIYIDNLPEPSILSIDPKISYYDLQESVFNSFSALELTQLNKDARQMILQKSGQSQLLSSAKAQGNDILDMIQIIAEQAGWKVQYTLDYSPKKNMLEEVE